MNVQLGGSQYSAETGRFDGTSPGTVNLPSPNNTVDEATVFFTNVGLTKNDMVNLLGTVLILQTPLHSCMHRIPLKRVSDKVRLHLSQVFLWE